MTNKQEELRQDIIRIVNDMTPDYDDELLGLVNSEVLSVLEELSNSTTSTFIAPTNGVEISKIKEIRGRYE